ncbi:MAG: pyridoxamine 5'-phosphate oxidase [Acidobacteriota bacterium]
MMLAEGHQNPVDAFLTVWESARAAAPDGVDPTTVALASADVRGRPSVRMVLLKGADQNGFVFYTNFASRKGRELDANPHGALCFFWPWLKLQVRVEGMVERVGDAEADEYFASRPRGSQLGAWASQQSWPIESRERLEANFVAVESRFQGQIVPRPHFWGGFRLVPDRVEFWQEHAFRMHDRLAFTRTSTGWRRERLQP